MEGKYYCDMKTFVSEAALEQMENVPSLHEWTAEHTVPLLPLKGEDKGIQQVFGRLA